MLCPLVDGLPVGRNDTKKLLVARQTGHNGPACWASRFRDASDSSDAQLRWPVSSPAGAYPVRCIENSTTHTVCYEHLWKCNSSAADLVLQGWPLTPNTASVSHTVDLTAPQFHLQPLLLEVQSSPLPNSASADVLTTCSRYGPKLATPKLDLHCSPPNLNELCSIKICFDPLA